jgi:hypothetical protein
VYLKSYPPGKRRIKTMNMRLCCMGSGGSDAGKDAPPLGLRPRGVRGTIGLVFLALAAWIPLWPLSVLTAWFGASHLVAAATGYRGCPEMGAIPSLVLRRRVSTVCKPWERLDQWLEPAARS